MAIEITDQNFEQVTNTDLPVVIDFWAVWCGPCKMIAPSIEALSNEYAGKAVIGKLDVDNNPEASFKYKVRNIPTVLFLQNGEIVDKVVGAVPKNVLEDKLKAIMAKVS
ncbi:MAG: thioredoxin [Bacteroidia bacterium]|nr:thioredoxin [Bacteroidia bacterium]